MQRQSKQIVLQQIFSKNQFFDANFAIGSTIYIKLLNLPQKFLKTLFGQSSGICVLRAGMIADEEIAGDLSIHIWLHGRILHASHRGPLL